MKECEREENSLYITLTSMKHDVADLKNRCGQLKTTLQEQRDLLTQTISNQSNVLTPAEVNEILEEDRKQIKLDAALVVKEQANDFFRKGDYNQAISLYTQAINDLTPYNLLALYLNRAAALQALGLYRDSIKDCEKAIQIDPSSAKAHRRLGSCYVYLEEYAKASVEYSRVLDIDESDQESRRMLEFLEKKMKPREEEQPVERDLVSSVFGSFGNFFRPFDDTFGSFFGFM
ncbi:hypothetical protein GEMRC1_002486 [Eukaryota sp. GEM-RC1]